MTREEFYMAVDQLVPNEKGCLVWAGESYHGYPLLTLNRAVRGNRVILERKLGRKILPKMQALHTCDNKACVNADHIYEGTHQQNMDDMVSRGLSAIGVRHGTVTHPEKIKRGSDHWAKRYPEKYHRGDAHWTRRLGAKNKGENNNTTVLSESDVQYIRNIGNTLSLSTQARKYGVNKSTIYKILKNKTWRHV